MSQPSNQQTTPPTLYALLDHNARRWWYHHELRRRGQVIEARRRERQSIRENVRTLRQARENGGFLTIGHHGWTLHLSKWHTLHSPYPGIEQPFPQCCLLLGIPIIDSTTIPAETICQVLRFPIASTHPDPEPPDGYHPLSHAPLKHVARLYRDLGATIYNLVL